MTKNHWCIISYDQILLMVLLPKDVRNERMLWCPFCSITSIVSDKITQMMFFFAFYSILLPARFHDRCHDSWHEINCSENKWFHQISVQNELHRDQLRLRNLHNELGPNMWIWIWGPCRAFWSLPLSEYLMLYSPASSRGKKFPQIEFGIQWLLPAFRINVTISLNLAANYNLGGEAQSFPFESLSQSFYFVSTNVFKGWSRFM